MKILVTGATGFVGAHLTRSLLNQGYQVRVLRRSHSEMAELKGLDVEHHIGDVTDPMSLNLATQSVDIVCHLAGVVGYSKSMRAVMDKVNIFGTRNIIDACLKK